MRGPLALFVPGVLLFSSLALIFVGIGTILIVAGIVLAVLSRSTKRRTVIDLEFLERTIERSAVGSVPYRGIVMPLHYEHTILDVSFEETSGRDVTVDLRDLIPEYGGGHKVLTYRQVTGAKGSFNIALDPGSYDIHIKSSDLEERAIKLKIKGIEVSKPRKDWREVGLAAITIGTFFLVEGLTLDC